MSTLCRLDIVQLLCIIYSAFNIQLSGPQSSGSPYLMLLRFLLFRTQPGPILHHQTKPSLWELSTNYPNHIAEPNMHHNKISAEHTLQAGQAGESSQATFYKEN